MWRTRARCGRCEYGVVIVAGSVHAGRHQTAIVDWAKHHAAALNGMPTGFGLGLPGRGRRLGRGAPRRARLHRGHAGRQRLEGAPTRSITVAGALQYREYDFVTRLVMRVLMRHGDHPTDITRDYDYTDWDAVEQFAGSFKELVAVPAS